ncbi:MAG: gamma-glutamyl-gamma-aminobutyrate hydrolase family protein [Candidatus Aminicenantales bacterium]
MKIFQRLFLAFFLCILLSAGLLPTEKQPPQDEKITVISLYPSAGTIRDWATLREKGLIEIPNLSVLGVYHERERTDYKRAQNYVKAKELDWFSFHPVSAPLTPEVLFRNNECTAEFGKLFEAADGVVFFGGPDILPGLYGEKTSLLTRVEDPYRHYLELSFVFHLLGGYQDESFSPLLDQQPDFPVVGFCLGGQTLNAGTGGTLSQDIWSEVYGLDTFEDVIALGPNAWHTNPFSRLFPWERFSSFFYHPIKFSPAGAGFCREIGFDPEGTPLVFSAHHQQAEKLGKGFEVIATSTDGKVTEAIAHRRFPNVLGVQFHPEAMVNYSPTVRVRFTPEDKEPFNLNAYLEAHPPTMEFHRKLWAWIAGTWVARHAGRRR